MPPDGSFDYISRRPEETVLYGVVSEQLLTFLARRQERDHTVPRFVEREFRDYLTCGIPSHGFLRVHCDSCGHDRVVPFSCKRRGFCPSCNGRKMADTAAHLLDRVFPIVPVRQWVLSLPFGLRYRMAYDAKLMGDILNVFVRVVFSELRRRAGRRNGFVTQCGAVTFVQRFGAALNLNVHFHLIALDGIYFIEEDGNIEFHELPPPEDAEVLQVAALTAGQVLRLIERRGLQQEADELWEQNPGLAELYAAAVQGRIAMGPNAGHRTGSFGGDHIDADSFEALASPRCATVSGFSVHANTAIPARDRQRLERLLRYAARPALASERLSRLPGGKVVYQLKRPWRDGTTDIVFEPLDFIARLAALVPAPRAHLTRYHGILAPAAKWRSAVVPNAAASVIETTELPASVYSVERIDSSREDEATVCRTTPAKRNYSWAQLMMRVFAIDVLKCGRCGARLRIMAAIHPPDATTKILRCLGLSCRAPPVAPAVSAAEPQDFL